jgi:hypothetical protein
MVLARNIARGIDGGWLVLQRIHRQPVVHQQAAALRQLVVQRTPMP